MKRFLNAIPLLLIMLFALAGPAAAQSSWLPAFKSDQRVYIAPGVDSTLQQAFSRSSFTSEVERAAQVHNLNVYVIVTVSGNDIGNDARMAGPVLSRKVWDSWTRTSGFNSDRALIIVMTGDGRALSSVGVRAGGYLNGLGIVRDTMSSQNGPVIPVLRTYLSSDPSAVPARIVANINGIVSAKTAPPATLSGGNTPDSGTTAEDNSMGLGTILIIIGVVAGGFFLLRWMTRPRSSTTGGYGSTPTTPRSHTTPRSGAGFESRMDRARRDRRTGDADDGADNTTNRNDGNSGLGTAAAVGAGVVGGVVLAETLRRNQEDDRRRDSGSTSSDSGYVAPVSTPSCSSSSSSGSSCSSSSGSSCGGGGSSCGGGGGGCGGGS